MQSHLFAPPRAPVIDTDGVLRDPGLRKPLAVWLMQALALLVAGACVWAGGKLILVFSLDATSAPMRLEIVWRLVVEAAVLACAVASIVGSQQGMAWARWLGLLTLAVVSLSDAAGFYVLLDWVSGLPEGAHVRSTDVLVFAALAATLCFALALAWAYAFSARCRAWFR